ncbi:MAG: bestrophin family ion channel [Cyclobacteriaceae bacterium]
MIRYNPKSWFSLLFDVYSRYVMRSLLPLIGFVAVSTTLSCFIVLDVLELDFEPTIGLHSILGIVLGLFLVLRTNTAYDRWWEGRKQWGQLVNDCRSLAMKINAFIPEGRADDRDFYQKMIPNMVVAMKEHLRDSTRIGEMDFANEQQMSIIARSKHRPNIIGKLMYERITRLRKEDVISADQLFLVDKELRGFANILGACERIKSTPIPFSYSMFIKKFLLVYAITLPIGFITSIGYWTIPLVLLAFYFLISIELISEEIEDPFGKDLNDLPLNELTIKIKENVNEIMEANLVDPQPVPLSTFSDRD